MLAKINIVILAQRVESLPFSLSLSQLFKEEVHQKVLGMPNKSKLALHIHFLIYLKNCYNNILTPWMRN